MQNIFLDPLALAVEGKDGKRVQEEGKNQGTFFHLFSAMGSFPWQSQFLLSRLLYSSISTWQPHLSHFYQVQQSLLFLSPDLGAEFPAGARL